MPLGGRRFEAQLTAGESNRPIGMLSSPLTKGQAVVAAVGAERDRLLLTEAV
jgi:hypothetical protein